MRLKKKNTKIFVLGPANEFKIGLGGDTIIGALG